MARGNLNWDQEGLFDEKKTSQLKKSHATVPYLKVLFEITFCCLLFPKSVTVPTVTQLLKVSVTLCLACFLLSHSHFQHINLSMKTIPVFLSHS